MNKPKKIKRVSGEDAERIVMQEGAKMAGLMGVTGATITLVYSGALEEMPAKDYLEVVKDYDGLAGVCLSGNIKENKKKVKKHRIYLFQEGIKNSEDALGTLFHELLHARLTTITDLVPENLHNKLHDIEEQLVRDLEKTFIRYLKEK